ncbi:hypothetical protein [Halomarina rubra]|uniref:hypothetical protein n=1 Tax=Halomarina rubra TaxID=2071873 RepID=UPI002032A8B8|nr:hypothetical protein [Halomarina rubra]
MQSTYPRGNGTTVVVTPTNDWTLACTECEFRGSASTEDAATELADVHRSVTDHPMVVGRTERAPS